MPNGSRTVLVAALAANLLIAITKFGAAAFTHSSAMLSEAVHSLVDTSNEVLLLYGARQAARPADDEHPLGHGREYYFWSFIVSLLIFAVGAGVSTYEGVRHVMNPVEMTAPHVNYIVLGIASVFEGVSWWFAFREFRRRKGKRGYLEAAMQTKDPTALIVFLEDSAALIGIAIAFAGTYAAQALDDPVYDGIASMAIGLLLGVVAIFLARENKRLLIGEPARDALVQSIARIARDDPAVQDLNGMLTFQVSPMQVIAALSLHFHDGLDSDAIESAVERLEARVRAQHPEILMLLVKPQRPAAYRRAVEARKRWREPGQS
ncbi:MAG TPA: cation diffusion facilitator family transporter [Usitatibacter sp.]|jgi:cation diffusion facilitator family transporter|nr:cation diffusion facilitator family transporter [Usitatibacter sp.]